jgi:hypothetical protein
MIAVQGQPRQKVSVPSFQQISQACWHMSVISATQVWVGELHRHEAKTQDPI